jgi:predicted O-linked N-acetylglucosamine transferase (SPINDLY family)
VLHHTGLSGFIADSPQQLVEMARHWSTRIDELAALRAGMRGRIAALPLLREQQVAHGFEQALEAMWSRWVAGQAPVALYCGGGPSGVTPAAKAC